MGGVLDAQVHAARENTAVDPEDYGVAVASTRSFEALLDPSTAQRDALQSVGMRAGLQGVRVDRRRNYIKGWEGSLELHPLTRGLGMLLRAAVGTSEIAQVGSTDAWLQTFSTAPGAANESLTFVVGRPPADPAADVMPWTYTGGVVHEFTLEQEVGDGDSGQLKATFGLDGRNELLEGVADDVNPSGGLALPTAAYPASDFVYGWPDLEVTIDGGNVGDTRSFAITLAHQLNRERYYMRRSTFKKQPIRTAVPEYSGSLAFDFENTDIYELVQSSDVVPLVAEWRHRDPNAIDTGQTFFLRLTAQVQFSGETPQVSLDDMPNQPIEFMALHDGTNPAVKIEYQSDDLAF
jgi:hypothetical protein